MQPVENSEHQEYTCRFEINTKKGQVNGWRGQQTN
jgi:hypothetical protein